jgi:hypothetical protein
MQPQQHAPPHVSADGAPPAPNGIVVCGRCEAIPAEVDCAQCAMLFCRGCSADLHGKGLFRMHALKPHANTLQPGTAAVVVRRRRASGRATATTSNKSWYRPEWDRVTAERCWAQCRRARLVCDRRRRRIGWRSRTQRASGAVGHAIIHIHNGENGRYGYSIEDRDITYPTLEQLLSGLSDLRFDLVPPPTAPSGSAGPAVRSIVAAALCRQAGAGVEKAQQSAVATGPAEFSPFLPRAVRKDESGRFEAPKYAALGQSQLQPQTAAALSTSVDVDERLQQQQQQQQQQPPPQQASPPPVAALTPPRSPAEANAMLPPTTTSRRTAIRRCRPMPR